MGWYHSPTYDSLIHTTRNDTIWAYRMAVPDIEPLVASHIIICRAPQSVLAFFAVARARCSIVRFNSKFY